MAWTGASRLRSVLGRRTQQSLATALGVNQGTVSKWLSGHRTPDIETLMRLCLELGVSADYLLLVGDGEDAVPAAAPLRAFDEIAGEDEEVEFLRPAALEVIPAVEEVAGTEEAVPRQPGARPEPPPGAGVDVAQEGDRLRSPAAWACQAAPPG